MIERLLKKNTPKCHVIDFVCGYPPILAVPALIFPLQSVRCMTVLSVKYYSWSLQFSVDFGKLGCTSLPAFFLNSFHLIYVIEVWISQ